MPLALVIEPDATQRLAARLVLNGEGFHVEEAETGDQGLAKARAFRPDIVVSAWQLPGLDGPQLLAALRQDADLWDVPALVLLCEGERADMRRARIAGADDALGKPMDTVELCEAVEALLARRDQLRANYTRMLRRRLGETLEQEKQQLALNYEKRLAQELGRGAGAPGVQQWREAVVASVEFGPAAVAAALASPAVADGLRQSAGRLRDLMQLFGATCLAGAENGLVAVFADPQGPRAALRNAARAMHAAAAALERPLDLVTGLDLGAALALPLPDPAAGDDRLQVLAGPAVAAAALVRRRARQMGWRAAAAPTLRSHAEGVLKLGRHEGGKAHPGVVQVLEWPSLEPSRP